MISDCGNFVWTDRGQGSAGGRNSWITDLARPSRRPINSGRPEGATEPGSPRWFASETLTGPDGSFGRSVVRAGQIGSTATTSAPHGQYRSPSKVPSSTNDGRPSQSSIVMSANST